MSIDPRALADELHAAYGARCAISSPPSSREPPLDLATAYEVEAELTRRRRAQGRSTTGRKVGYASKAVWRVFKLETLVWAHMYDDTVHYAENDKATLSLAQTFSPKIEPEIVFRLKDGIEPGLADPAVILGRVEWMALGFEIIDCPFAEWKFAPPDFVAAYGLHAALVVGTPRELNDGDIATVADQLPRFKARLFRDGQLVDEGSGRNSLRSPALCLGELATAISCQPKAEPLERGELVSTGTLTGSPAIASGEIWTASVDLLELPDLTLTAHV